MTKKILIVDDEADFIKMISIRLIAHGYTVITAADGKDGLAKIASEKPDAVLLDILMPKIDGLRVLKIVRKRDKDLPIFIITAYSDQKRFRLAKQLNASGFIVKTGDLAKEVENINNVLHMASKYKKTVETTRRAWWQKNLSC